VANPFTVTTIGLIVPVQELSTGVMEYVTVPPDVETRLSVIELPDPEFAPVTLLCVAVQLNVAPDGVEVRVKFCGPGQTGDGSEVVTVGNGFTVNELATDVAGLLFSSPIWLAVIVTLPDERPVTTFPLTNAIEDLELVYTMSSPAEVVLVSVTC
jgi:hypothetical protein